jgi:hypothetical protein
MAQYLPPKYPNPKTEGHAMNVSDWFIKRFNLRETSEVKAAHRDLVDTAYSRVEEVSKLREDLLENRDFPIASFIRGERSPAVPRRTPK